MDPIVRLLIAAMGRQREVLSFGTQIHAAQGSPGVAVSCRACKVCDMFGEVGATNAEPSGQPEQTTLWPDKAVGLAHQRSIRRDVAMTPSLAALSGRQTNPNQGEGFGQPSDQIVDIASVRPLVEVTR